MNNIYSTAANVDVEFIDSNFHVGSHKSYFLYSIFLEIKHFINEMIWKVLLFFGYFLVGGINYVLDNYAP
eukprot:Pgem_evm1s14928